MMQQFPIFVDLHVVPPLIIGDAPALAAKLRLLRKAALDMHAIQTSGNCIRNITSDPLAGAAHDEIANPLGWCEIIRQWSTLHPEFAFLPRKFKIAVFAGTEDRAATGFHDIGLRLIKNSAGELGFRVLVGGGQGRTPRVAQIISAFLPERYLLSYLEAILRVYNAAGRRDNIYKARIKILIEVMGKTLFLILLMPNGCGLRTARLTCLKLGNIGSWRNLRGRLCHR